MHSRSAIIIAVILTAMTAACSKPAQETTGTESGLAETEPMTAVDDGNAENPFFASSELYLHYPPFDQIETSHYLPAFEKGMAEQLQEIDIITSQADDPTFENTLVALEKSGQILNRVGRVFFNMTSAHTNDELEAIDSEMAPKLAAHADRILLDEKLFQRIQAVYNQRDQLGLDPESYRLVVEYHDDFVRAGARLSEKDKETLKSFNAELASLETQFGQNVLAEVNASAVVVDTREELAGLSDAAIAAAVDEAHERGLDGKYVLTLLNTSGQPALASLENRDLREKIHRASLARGSRGGDFDNRAVMAQVMKIRAERARLLGFANHAAYSLSNQTARTTEAVNERLASLAAPAARNALLEATDLQATIDAEGGDFKLASWDWSYYSEKVSKARFDFDGAQLKPYLELNNVLTNGVFYAAEMVFGITFKERTDLPIYQEDVRTWEVFNADGTTLALFVGDFYARPSKRGGAWMNEYVSQSSLTGYLPVVGNHLNIPEPAEGEPALLTWDEVITLFHEFGHALHGMFSDVSYPSFSGTEVPRDFVEYPSQVNEMWAVWPEVLKNYAVHYQTGEAMPTELLDKVLAAQKFNQGFDTTEALAAALLDQAWHQLNPDQVPDSEGVLAFEANALQQAGVSLPEVPPRYRSTYFSHIMGGYDAGYYAYSWSEVLDADTVRWFKDNGGMKRENGDHFRKTLLSRGGSEDAMELFRNFSGADPDIAPLLERLGLN